VIFVDSNIPMYVAGRDHPLREPARRFLARVRAGEIEACTSTEVLQEMLYRYAALKRPDLAREVYDLFVQFCPVVLPVTLADTDRGLGPRLRLAADRRARRGPCRGHDQQCRSDRRHLRPRLRPDRRHRAP